MGTKERKKPLHEHGEYISLNWEYGTPDDEYVRGHVTPAEFAAAYDKCHTASFEPPTPAPPEVTHLYGRWSREAGDEDFGNGLSVLRTYSERGPGRFPITSAPYKVMQDLWWNSKREAAERTPELT